MTDQEQSNIFSLERVLHEPNQVLFPEELVVGGRYYFKSSIPPKIRDEFVVTSFDELETGFFGVITRDEGKTMYHLADKGIIPYGHDFYDCCKGKWNAVNYIVPTLNMF